MKPHDTNWLIAGPGPRNGATPQERLMPGVLHSITPWRHGREPIRPGSFAPLRSCAPVQKALTSVVVIPPRLGLAEVLHA